MRHLPWMGKGQQNHHGVFGGGENIKTQQIGMSKVTPEYQAFVDKFEHKLTTDDCYTPEKVYEVVKTWVFQRYNLRENTQVIRPFWPGGDYQAQAYPDGCVVIDNPPFSILSEIERFYLQNEIAFFLFAPGTSMYKAYKGMHYVHPNANVIYKNGANVNTGFVTNLGENLIETAPELGDAVRRAGKNETKKLGKYSYPMELVTAARMNWLAGNGIRYSVKESEALFVRKIDGQTKGVFGGGFLISERAAAERAAAERAAAERAAAERAAAERAAAERAAAERITLSEREKKIVEELGGNGK